VTYEIVAVRYGTVRSHKSELFYRYEAYGEPDASQDMDFFFYVLRRGEEVIVVDTGFRPLAAAPRGRECLTDPVQALARLGVDPARVSRLLITHLHWDHIGNVEHFAAAELFVPATELEFWSAPVARNLQFWAHVDPEAVALILGAWREGRVTAIGEQQEIAPGLSAITVGGHSPGQQVLCVETAGGRVVLASDAVHLYEELELERPFSVMVNLREMCEGYELLKQLRAAGASIVPGHDPLVSARYPDLGGDAAGLAFQIA
jgi:glyoxylase-like metal-dependent hydrolase (beta-lactamase superfamily II)